MKNPLVAFNSWYDRLPEPWRLIGCLILAGPLCVMGLFPQYMAEIMLYTLGLIIMRMWWTSRKPAR